MREVAQPTFTGLPEEPAPRGRLQVAAGVGLATILVFLPALRGEFVDRDDVLYVTRNPFIRHLDAALLREAFLHSWAANWHPLTWISHALDYAVWGLHPLGHHLTSVLLHAANSAMVVLLVFSLLGLARPRGGGDPGGASWATHVAAAATGLLFAVHPLRVESVAWVSERKDVLCGSFYLLALLAYCGFLRATRAGGPLGPRAARYAVVLALFSLALMSKPMAVSLPVVLVLMDWVPGERITDGRALVRVLIEKAPFAGLVVLSAFLTYSAQASGGTVVSVQEVPLSSRLAIAASALVTYLRESVWPVGLSPFNSAPDDVSLLSPGPLVSLCVVGLLSAGALLFLRRRWPAALWAYYCATLLPVIGLVKVGLQATADRYTYLPSLGPTLLAGLAIGSAARTAAASRHRRAWGAVVVTAALSLTATLAILSARQIGIWRTSVSLWTCAIDVFPRTAGTGPHQAVFEGILYRNRGMAHADRGENLLALQDLGKAIALYPSSADLRADRGIVNLRAGRMDEALADLDAALQLVPDSPTSLAYRALVLRNLGRDRPALEDYTRAIAIQPDSAELRSERAEIFYRLGFLRNAVEDLDSAIRLNPRSSELYYNRAHLRRRLSQEGPATADLTRACDLGLQAACAERGR
jgi:hypothetical protein